MDYLNRDSILNAPDAITEDVDVPEWQGTVRIRALTAADRDAFEASITSENGKGVNRANLRAKLVARALVDPETNERTFSDEDVDALGRKSAAALDRLFAVAQRLSGIGEQDVEELVKNSDGGP